MSINFFRKEKIMAFKYKAEKKASIIVHNKSKKNRNTNYSLEINKSHGRMLIKSVRCIS